MGASAVASATRRRTGMKLLCCCGKASGTIGKRYEGFGGAGALWVDFSVVSAGHRGYEGLIAFGGRCSDPLAHGLALGHGLSGGRQRG